MMGSLSPIHWIIILVVAALVFGGRGKISGLMGDAAQGIKAFRDGLKDEDKTPPPPVAPAMIQPAPVTQVTTPDQEDVKK
jgi:sec-independent protein translocase protein TatA